MSNLATLSAEDITSLLAGGRNRGGYERTIRKFVTSEELAWNVMDLVEYKMKEPVSVANSFTNNAKRLTSENADWPTLRVVNKKEDGVFLINVEAYELALAGPDTDENDENSDVEDEA